MMAVRRKRKLRVHISYLHKLGLGVRHLRSNDGHGKHSGLEFGIPYTAVTERRVLTIGVTAISGQDCDGYHGSAKQEIQEDGEGGEEGKAAKEAGEKGGEGSIDDGGTGHTLHGLHPGGYALVVLGEICIRSALVGR